MEKWDYWITASRSPAMWSRLAVPALCLSRSTAELVRNSEVRPQLRGRYRVNIIY